MSLLKGLNLKGKVLYNEPLCKHTTFRIGAPAKVWAEPQDLDDMISLLEISKAEGPPIFLIGEGSNLLVSDEGLDIMAVSLRRSFNFLKISDDKITSGAGCGLQKFILKTLGDGYSGLEFMAGIPGTVGGAIKMNAGSGLNGPWISNFIERLKVINHEGKTQYIEKRDLKFGYRESGLKGFIILEADFNLEGAKDKTVLLNEYERFLREKKSKQDLSTPSAGCVFKNPGGSNLSAGRLIEECGFKGKKVGDAMVSDRHANFIVNLGNATFKDVTGLVELIRSEVDKKFGIKLETEIEIIAK